MSIGELEAFEKHRMFIIPKIEFVRTHAQKMRSISQGTKFSHAPGRVSRNRDAVVVPDVATGRRPPYLLPDFSLGLLLLPPLLFLLQDFSSLLPLLLQLLQLQGRLLLFLLEFLKLLALGFSPAAAKFLQSLPGLLCLLGLAGPCSRSAGDGEKCKGICFQTSRARIPDSPSGDLVESASPLLHHPPQCKR